MAPRAKAKKTNLTKVSETSEDEYRSEISDTEVTDSLNRNSSASNLEDKLTGDQTITQESSKIATTGVVEPAGSISLANQDTTRKDGLHQGSTIEPFRTPRITVPVTKGNPTRFDNSEDEFFKPKETHNEKDGEKDSNEEGPIEMEYAVEQLEEVVGPAGLTSYLTDKSKPINYRFPACVPLHFLPPDTNKEFVKELIQRRRVAVELAERYLGKKINQPSVRLNRQERETFTEAYRLLDNTLACTKVAGFGSLTYISLEPQQMKELNNELIRLRDICDESFIINQEALPKLPRWGRDGNLSHYWKPSSFEVLGAAYRTEVEAFLCRLHMTHFRRQMNEKSEELRRQEANTVKDVPPHLHTNSKVEVANEPDKPLVSVEETTVVRTPLPPTTRHKAEVTTYSSANVPVPRVSALGLNAQNATSQRFNEMFNTPIKDTKQ
ncbi:hypothetical protein CVT24_001455 [Panaeolus cyanescens]|uniref:Uncharacterized protein n=1 Tax=Panaeolus cyanescens TaxID=181874 RepID=A0A409WJ03_9AGAR|nr:hypothetical protein CVT24_001455 [Panaeolus cyanescens]